MAVCILTYSKYNWHTKSLFKKVEILPLFMLIDYFKLQFMHRFIINELPTVDPSKPPWAETLKEDWIQTELSCKTTKNYSSPPPLKTQVHWTFSLCSGFLACGVPSKKSTLNAWSTKMYLTQNLFLNMFASSIVCDRLLCPHCHLLPQ